MITILHKTTGAVLHEVDARSLERADLSGLNLAGATFDERIRWPDGFSPWCEPGGTSVPPVDHRRDAGATAG